MAEHPGRPPPAPTTAGSSREARRRADRHPHGLGRHPPRPRRRRSSSTCATARGICQVVARPEVSRDAHDAADQVRAEYVVAVMGEVVRALGRHREPRASTRARSRCWPGRSASSPRRRRRRLPDRGRGRDPRGDPPEVPLPRPAPPPDAAEPAAAPPGDDGDPPLPRRAGLPRDRDADAHQVHAGGRARLPGALAASTTGSSTRCRSRRSMFKQLLMVGGLRPVLPDRPLLPRRGPARRPPARVHPGRRRDVVPARGVDLRAGGAAVRAGACALIGVEVQRPFPRLRLRGRALDGTARTSRTCASTCRSRT